VAFLFDLSSESDDSDSEFDYLAISYNLNFCPNFVFEHIVTISSVLSIIEYFVVSHQFNQFLFHFFFKRDVAQCTRVAQLRNTERRSSVVVVGELTVILDRSASDPELSELDSSQSLRSTPLLFGCSDRRLIKKCGSDFFTRVHSTQLHSTPVPAAA
jgi:hypothetical protein